MGSKRADSSLMIAKVILQGMPRKAVVSVADRVALLLAIKEPGKSVTFEHVFEKVSRDVAFTEQRRLTREEVRATVQTMVQKGLAVQQDELVLVGPGTDRAVEDLVKTVPHELNRSYRLVWTAQRYYPQAAKYMLPFLKGRAVSTVKVFSGKANPIDEVDPVFVRYAKYKPKPVPLQIETTEALMQRVYDHCVDFIPYVHKLNAQEPDVFVLDLDAGSAVLRSPAAFEFVKYVTFELGNLLLDFGIQPMVKFSGSRGFQIWAKFDNASLRKVGDVFGAYRDMAVRVQKALETRLQRKLNGLRRGFPEIVREGHPVTTADVAHKDARAGQVLVDSSVLKPMGDVRAPFSIHYKTGLVSVPIPVDKVVAFDLSDAQPLNVAEHLGNLAQACELRFSDPTRLIN